MEDSKRKETQFNLKSIVETSEKWLGRLREREYHVRLASSFLTTILVFVFAVGSVLGYFLSQGNLRYLFLHPFLLAGVSISCLVAAIAGGFATYFILRRRQEAGLKDLSDLVAEMRKIEITGGAIGSETITEKALSLVDRIVALLPALVRKRNQDPLIFGIATFLLVTLLGSSTAGVLAGIVVFLYFRHETKKTYEQEISRLEAQKRSLEQRKKDFLETL
jgi:MFS family permease